MARVESSPDKAITRDGQLLLARRRGRPEAGCVARPGTARHGSQLLPLRKGVASTVAQCYICCSSGDRTFPCAASVAKPGRKGAELPPRIWTSPRRVFGRWRMERSAGAAASPRRRRSGPFPKPNPVSIAQTTRRVNRRTSELSVEICHRFDARPHSIAESTSDRSNAAVQNGSVQQCKRAPLPRKVILAPIRSPGPSSSSLAQAHRTGSP